ncbi:MAG: glycosyltransferase family 2 protein [Kiritimatiellia bacterium]
MSADASHNPAPALSIVLPCYNEARNIPGVLRRFAEVLGGRTDTEVLLVDNGSTDDTAVVLAQELAQPAYSFARVVTVPKNIGYGYGIMSGVRQARAPVIAWTHADLQTDPADVLQAYQNFSTAPNPPGTFLKGKRVARNPFDALFTFGMSLIASLALRARLFDVNAQPKMFHRSLLDQLANPPNDFSLDLFVLYTARKLGLIVLEQPVDFSARKHGEAKGGGTLAGKLRLIRRTWNYILALRRELQTKERAT